MDGYNWSNFRNYELSVWTLQDSYITTLKSADPLTILSPNESDLPARVWSQARAQGLVLNGEMTINIDGTLSLTFDVPMYIFRNGVREENPNWYNVIDGNVLTSMRKIKVIFNKWDEDADKTASTFEFMIVKVQESHEKNELVCHIECEGLAFHELGKVGYKRSLSAQEFYDEYYNWAKLSAAERAARHLVQPKNNLQYWLSKAKIDPVPTIGSNGTRVIDIDRVNSTKWYYLIRMAHSSLVHKEVSYDDTIYEEGFPTAWGEDETPINYVETREKYRLVDLNESNLYNITLDLAEKFEVFCKYEYLYDTNYNIIGRVIVFYNNFLLEGKDVVTLMYPNSANKIERIMDSTDVSTKMFVRSVDSSDVYTGIVNIMDCDANYMREDYLLNFDYLHDIGTITDELYDAIGTFRKTIRKLNDLIVPLQNAYNKLSDMKVDVEAKIKTLNESISLDLERITENVAKINAIDATDGVIDGYITRDWRNPEAMTLLKDSSNANYDTYYVLFNGRSKTSGVVSSSVLLYKTYNTGSTRTYSYAISYRKLSLDILHNTVVTNNNSKLEIALPGSADSAACIWRDYPITYKGTLGYKGTVDSLPSTDDTAEKDAYKVLVDGAAKGYVYDYPWVSKNAEINQWLYYTEYETIDHLYHWEIRGSRPSGSTNLGSIGKEGTAGITTTALPAKPKQGDALLVKSEKYVSGMVRSDKQDWIGGINARANLYLVYTKYTRGTLELFRWEIKDSLPSGATEKGTIGQKSNTGTLPTVNNRKQGWVYKCTYTKTYTENEGPSITILNGGLVIFNGTSWEVFNPPPKKQSEPAGEKVDTDLGFYIYKRERLKEINGPTVEAVSVSRYGATKTNKNDFISNARYVFYTNAITGEKPVLPTIESATTEATLIHNNNQIDAWTSYLSVPTTPVDYDIALTNYNFLNDYEIHCALELRYKLGKHVFINTNGNNDNVTPTVIYNDALGSNILELVRNAAAFYLADPLEGSFEYDESGNLDKITGLFKMVKSGSYYTYGLLEGGIKSLWDETTVTAIDNAVATLKTVANSTTMPTAKKDKFVLIHNTTYWTNNNVTHSYTLKYYNADGLEDSPADANTQHYVQSIVPIFYLKTNSDSVPTPGDGTNNTVTVSNDKIENTWTTNLPDKTNDNHTYYRGWKVTYYGNGGVKYYAKKKATDLLKKPKMSEDSEDGVIPQYIYATYKYKPALYYEKIKASYEQKLYDDTLAAEAKKERNIRLTELLDEVAITLDDALAKKETAINNFEHLMGAALRESYWQPEDEYQDYGTRYNEDLELWWANPLYNTLSPTDLAAAENVDIIAARDTAQEYFSSIGWGDFNSDDEEKLYYESSINQTKVYYKCIDLSNLSTNGTSFFEMYRNWIDNQNKPVTTVNTYVGDSFPLYFTYSSGEETDENDATVNTAGASISVVDSGEKVAYREFFAFFFNPSAATIPSGGDYNDLRYCQYYAIGSGATFAFIQTANGIIKPVLMLKDADKLSDTELANMLASAKLGKVFITDENSVSHNIILSYDSSMIFDVRNNFIPDSVLENSKVVYPRILVPSLKLKNNSTDLVVKYDGNLLQPYEDYYVLTHSCYTTPIATTTTELGFTTPLVWNDKAYSYYKNLEALTVDELASTERYNTVYSITIKPEYILKNIALEDVFTSVATQYEVTTAFNVFYMLSNADIDIYLDAKKVLKENAYPKVSYEINVSMWSKELLRNIHTKLAQLVMINDFDLKFQNTFGYISQVKLNLDHEEQDAIEVKNYKTKFEDLFSRIVAETEEMHKNGHNIGLAGALASADSIALPIDSSAFDATLHDLTNREILLAFLSEYFDGPEVVLRTVAELFNEAGEILNAAAASLDGTVALTTENASILAGFKENVVAALTPKIFTGDTPPAGGFKVGDIWMNDNVMAVATTTEGFTQTYDGKLAEIAGANISVNAITGIVDITGETNINLTSGKELYIAAGDTVNIIGNKEVNIGGTTINMASAHVIGDGYEGENGIGGLHLVATEYNYIAGDTDDDTGSLEESSTSRVDIHGEGIELASKKGIIIKSGEGIKIYSSNQGGGDATDYTHGTAAVKINSTEGIWLGSNKPLRLFSGNVRVDDEGNVLGSDDATYDAVGANIELNAEHLLLGIANVASGVSATAIELTNKNIILAAGDLLAGLSLNADGTYNLDELTETNISGILIKSDYIGLATGENSYDEILDKWVIDRSLLSLKPGRVRIGLMRLVDTNNPDDPASYDGSFVWLENSLIYVGGMGDLTLNTNNIKIQTKLFTDGGEEVDPREPSSTAIASVSKMGFVLGKNLQDSVEANRIPALGFWIDTEDNAHLVVDSSFVRFSRDGVLDTVALTGDAVINSKTLYKATASKTTVPTKPTGYSDWGLISSLSIENVDSWTTAIPEIGGSGGLYVWRITEVEYGNSKFRCTTPVYENLTDTFASRIVREYVYATSIPTATANLDWTEIIPSHPLGTNTESYYYGNLPVTIGDTATNTTLYNDDATTQWTARPISGTVYFAPYASAAAATAAGATTSSYTSATSGYAVKVRSVDSSSTGGAWIAVPSAAITKHPSSGYHLYSRRHTYRYTSEDVYDDVRLEEQLESLSEAGILAMNISTGIYPVSSVSSSGLVVEGNNVILGSTGKLYMLGNAEVMVGTSSSNSAMILNKNGISIGSGADISIAAGGSIELLVATKGDTNNIMIQPGAISMGTGTLTIAAENFMVGGLSFAAYALATSEADIENTLRVYHRDYTRTPSNSWLALSSTLDELTSVWQANLSDVSNSIAVNDADYKYLFSTIRLKLKDGTYRFPGPIVYEGEYDKLETIRERRYCRSAANVAASSLSTDPSAWTTDVPEATYVTATKYEYTSSSGVTSETDTLSTALGGVGYTAATETTISNPWVWHCTVVSDIHSGSAVVTDIERDEEFENYNNAQIAANNIASGRWAVPRVESSGLVINGNYVGLKSAGTLELLGNSKVLIGSASSNSALILDSNGITVGTTKDIAIAGGSLSVLTTGTFTVDSSNFKVSTSATTGNSIFKISDGASSSEEVYINVKKTSAGASVQLGSWYVKPTFIGTHESLKECKVGMRYNEGNSNQVAFFAGASGTASSNGANLNSAKFRVTTDGKVYMNALMILDKVEDGKWSLNGKTPGNGDGHTGTYTEGGVTYGYIEIDFSGLNFTEAVSISGAWSGTTFNVTANLWSKIHKTVGMSTTITKAVATATNAGNKGSLCSGSCTVTLSINGQSKSNFAIMDCTIGASTVWQDGYDTGVIAGYNSAVAVQQQWTDCYGPGNTVTLTDFSGTITLLGSPRSDCYKKLLALS